jgi:hypothetical protein
MRWSVFTVIIGLILLPASVVCNYLSATQPLLSAFVPVLAIAGVAFVAVGVVLYIKTKGEFKK